jgi:hypothetical protein
VVGSRAAIAAQQLATVAALHAVADVAVCVCAVDQGAKLLEGQVVFSQVRELRRPAHLRQHKHTTRRFGTTPHAGKLRGHCCAQCGGTATHNAIQGPYAAQQLDATSKQQ